MTALLYTCLYIVIGIIVSWLVKSTLDKHIQRNLSLKYYEHSKAIQQFYIFLNYAFVVVLWPIFFIALVIDEAST